MGTSVKLLIFLSVTVTIADVVSGHQSNNTRAFSNVGPNRNVSTVGICEVEVSVISILPPEQRHTASFIRGNGTNPGFSKIRICCAGYNTAPNAPFHCLPSCPNGCGLGNCTAPNVCSCNKGATPGPDGKCVTACPRGCLNGQCYGEFCNCNSGFTLAPNGKYCISGCTRNCGPGGQCIANNQCKCQPGYQINKQGVCDMICDKGYRVVGNACEPQCTGGCLNGECIAPNRCACNAGYNLERNGTCTPKCSSPCYNGFCSAPNVCTCKQGYVKDTTSSKSRCIPYCAQGCPNGICSAPNFCICKQGYVKQAKGSNVCVKK